MKLSRQTLLIIGLVLFLILVTAAAALFQSSQAAAPALSSNSTAPEGAQALRLWLSAAGYQVDNQPAQSYSIPTASRALLILEPSFFYSITSEEWKTLDAWVRQGGILLLAAHNLESALHGNPFEVSTTAVDDNEFDLLPPAPIFRSPPQVQPAHLKISYVFEQAETGGLGILSVPSGPVALQFSYGNGEVLLVADSYFLSNAGLKAPGNAQLALNLISQIPQGSSIWIDEWHHGERAALAYAFGFEDWLTQTSGGHAVLYVVGVIFLGLVLAGRPFGRPRALAHEQVRRRSLEYIVALANLNRRAGHRQAVMKYYAAELKRTLSKRYRLNPSLPDDEFVSQVTRYNPAISGSELTDLLDRLGQKSFTEIQMIQLARKTAGWMEKIVH